MNIRLTKKERSLNLNWINEAVVRPASIARVRVCMYSSTGDEVITIGRLTTINQHYRIPRANL